MDQRPNSSFHNVVSALVYAIARERAGAGRPDLQPPYNDLTQFVLQQHARMARYLSRPLMAATLGFDAIGILLSGRRFHKLPPEARLRQIEAWKDSRIGFKRDWRVISKASRCWRFTAAKLKTGPDRC